MRLNTHVSYRWVAALLLAALMVVPLSSNKSALSQDSALQKIESDDPLVQRAGNWTAQSATSASGGSYLYSSGSAEDVLTLTFSGPTVEVVYVAGPNLGILAIEVDGTVVRTVITQAGNVSFGQRAVVDYLTDEAHTVRVYGSQGVVAVDGFYAKPELSGEGDRSSAVEQAWTQNNKLLASDGAADDRFGQTVAISGDTAIVGAYLADDGPTTTGAAYIFTRNGTSWTQTAKLLASDGANLDYFGFSVGIFDDTAIVGAYGANSLGSDSGAAYIFTRNGTSWTQTAKLTASDGAIGDNFGHSVAISGDAAIIGAFGDDDRGSLSGSAYIFTHSGGTWTQTAKLTASDGAANDEFGSSAGISGDTAIVGAFGDDDGGAIAGAAYIFTHSGGNWTQTAKLTASDETSGDRFGGRVQISGDTAIIGASGDDDGGASAGAAYIFTHSGGNWTQTAKLTATDGAANDEFGSSAGISGDTVIVGAFGDDDGGANAGAAYIFTHSGGNWTQSAKLTASDGAAGDGFGLAVAISGDTSVIGARDDDDRGTNSGSAYIYSNLACAFDLCSDVDGGLNGAYPPTAKVFYVNGICTSPNEHRQGIADIQAIVGPSRPVLGIYSQSALSGTDCDAISKATDAAEAINQLIQLTLNIPSDNAAVYSLVNQIQQYFLTYNQGSTTARLELIGHSQGGLVIAQALQYLSQYWSFWDYFKPRIDVVTMGGAGPSFPVGPTYRHIVHHGYGRFDTNPDDPIPWWVGVDSVLSSVDVTLERHYLRQPSQNQADCGESTGAFVNHSLCSYLRSYVLEAGSTDALVVYNSNTQTISLVETLTDVPPAGDFTTYSLGRSGQIVMGDWDGDGQKTPGVYAADGVFYTTNDLGQTTNWTGTWFGFFGKPPVAGRFDPSRPNDCIGVVDDASFPPFGTAFALYFTCDISGGNPSKTFQWLSVLLPDSQGHSGQPQFAAGDFNGDTVDSIAIRRGAYVSFNDVAPTIMLALFSRAQYFGTPSGYDYGQFVVGDWDNSTLDSFGLYYQNSYFFRRNDLDWNSGQYILQRVGYPIGTPVTASSWRQR